MSLPGIAAAGATLLAVVVVALTPAAAAATPAETGGSDAVLHLFWAEGCPHCEAEWAWIGGLQRRHPDLEVVGHEVSTSPAEAELWASMSRERGVEPRGVPTTVLGDRIWVGFDPTTTTASIEAAVVEALEGGEVSATREEPTADQDGEAVLEVPLAGTVDLSEQPLLLSSVLIGFVDGFNPCSLWVLSLLLALVLHSGSRRRIVLVGGTFLAVTTVLYGVYVAGLLSVLAALSYAVWVRVAMAGVAGLFGLVNIKDHFAFRRGPSLSIPERAKPTIYRRMRRITAEDAPLPAVLGGTALLAVGVSVVETPCTAGLPLVWSNLLAAHGVGTLEAAGLFAAYMAVFLLDELAVLAVAVVTMRAMRVQERHGRALKLGSGMVMLALAATLLFAPGLLLEVSGTLLVFGAAAGATAAVLLVEHVVDRRRVTKFPVRPAAAEGEWEEARGGRP